MQSMSYEEAAKNSAKKLCEKVRRGGNISSASRI
jgi:hypothetical protein